MSEKKIGTLESFQPLIIDETHKTWSNAYGQYWDFFGTIDGVKGIFSAKSTTPRWEQGQKVSYTSTHKEGNQYPKFKMEKLDEHTQKPVASSYNDPASIRSQAYGTATEQALRTFVELEKAVESPDKVDALAKFYYGWLMKEVKDRDSFYVRSRSLSNAIESIKHEKFGLRKLTKPTGALIALADHYFDLAVSVRSDETVQHA